MNKRKRKKIDHQVKIILMEWIKTLVPEDQKDQVNLQNVLTLAPAKEYIKKEGHEVNLSVYHPRWIKQKVKLHKHVYHTENVLIDKGFGEFQINDSIYKVAAGDWIVIPKNTWHGVVVNSKSTMKVISVQSPEYFGKDRIFKD